MGYNEYSLQRKFIALCVQWKEISEILNKWTCGKFLCIKIRNKYKQKMRTRQSQSNG